MGLSNGLIIFLILIGCLASVAILAAVLRPFQREETVLMRSFPPEQAAYMRSVRDKSTSIVPSQYGREKAKSRHGYGHGESRWGRM
ncbi:hypothetical protein BJX64DRAFT_289080 [Aspergillus heterothallicus]